MNKRIVNSIFAGVFLLGIASPKLSFFWDKKEVKVQERVEEAIQVNNPDVGNQENVKERVRNFVGTRAAIGTGKVVSKDGATLTIAANENTYTVLTDAKTQFRRMYWGKSSLDEVSIGNMVRVVGRWQDQERTQLRAVIVRNLSVQKREGVFFGVVTSVGENSFMVQTARRGEISISVNENTEIVDREMNSIQLSDIASGQRLRVKGTWNVDDKTLEDVEQIKVFSLPPAD